MCTTRAVVGAVLAVSSLALAGAGCAYMRRQKAQQIEPMLSAAGFKMKLADTPEKLAKMQAMPQLRLRSLTRKGKVYYAYTDAEGCRCTYLGDASAYQNYQALVQQRQIAGEDTDAGNVTEDTAIVEDNELWESWGPDD
jgi:hypothetical protein